MNHIKKSSILCSILIAVLFLVFSAVAESKVKVIAYQDNTVKVLKNSFPSIIEIPSIGVNTKIVPVGLTPAGNMDMTNSIKNVAWYSIGPKPGEVGSAVIGGHFGYPGPAVFRNLENLKPGDIVCVKDSNGKISNFVVRKILTYKSTDIVKDVFYSGDGASHLNLVTCNGKWIPSLRTYNKRTVVFTDKIS